MLIGYVSDERYIALHDTQFEIASETLHVETRSRATGEIFADIPPSPYNVTCQKNGYGPKQGQIRQRGLRAAVFRSSRTHQPHSQRYPSYRPHCRPSGDSSPGSNAGRAPLGVLRAVERTLGATPESWHPKRRKRLS